MIWYIGAVVLSMLFASAAQRLKGKAQLNVVGGTFHYRSSYYFMAVMSFLPLFLVAALRSEVGTDWPIYQEYYDWINAGVKGFSEKLFNLMNKFMSVTGLGFRGLVVLVAFLSCLFLFKAIYEQSISAPLAILVFFLSSYYFASMNQMRQAISMPIMLYAYKHVRDRKFWWYLLWCLLASTIHASALVYLPLYFIAQIKPSVRRYAVTFGVILVTLPLLHWLLEVFMRYTKYAWYSTSVFNVGDEANNFYLLGFLFQLVMFIIMAYYRFTADPKDKVYDGMLNSYFVSLILLLFTPALSQILRVSQSFGYCQILLIPRVINCEKNRTRRIVLYILLVGLYTAKLLYDTYSLGWNGVIPYQSIL